jgi:hypothetical protein
MRTMRLVLGALASALGLAACSLLPSGPSVIHDDVLQRCDARMEQIAEALNNRDAAALKAMFSAQALEQATDIDDRLEYLLSFFPPGRCDLEEIQLRVRGTDFVREEDGTLESLLHIVRERKRLLLVFRGLHSK